MTNKIEFTKDQQNAIYSRGGTLFVSAAAGSGKTAVLTERVVKLLADESDDITPAELLIVTYTRAAASEMREKIAKALRREIAETGNKRLKRQLMLLSFADICTMDAFCAKLIKENFHLADITTSFKTLSESELEMFYENAANIVLEELYKTKSEIILQNADLFIEEKGDEKLSDTIINLHKYSQSYPFPKKWLESLKDMYNPDIEIGDTVWGQVIIDYIKQSLEYAGHISKKALDISLQDEYLADNYLPAIESDLAQINEFKEISETNDYNSLINAVKGFVNKGLGKKTQNADKNLREAAKAMRDTAVNNIKKLWNFDFPTTDEHKEDIVAIKPAIDFLIHAVYRLDEELNELKKAENAYSFSDILHKSISLLVNENGERTTLCTSLSQKYREILIDEYQDTNEAQDMLFYAISKDGENLFFVGDVKQSVYGFRLAMPEIFLSKKEKMPLFDGVNYPSQINLSKNFRSRKEICQYVNHIFSRIMTKQSGELNYSKSEKLVPAAEYPETEGAKAELIILNTPNDTKAADSRVLEADYVADYIEKTVKSGFLVTKKGKTCPAVYGDFTILLRTVKDTSYLYYNALKERGIPVSTVSDTNFFSTREIAFVHSLLRVIDNPLLDVPLAAVLMFPVFGFSAAELACIRLANSEEPLYSGLIALANNGDKKAEHFLDALARFRNHAATLNIVDLLFYLYEETALWSVISAMEQTEERRRNLLTLLNFASDYTNGRESTLGSFIRFLNKVRKSGKGIEASAQVSLSDTEVKIMSIHKSKGLEFPIVILAGCSKAFNNQYVRKDLLIDRTTGIGMLRRDVATLSKYKTIPIIATRLSIEKRERAEELRLLYVAMTRAKEKLTMVCTKEEKSNFSFTNTMLSENGDIYPFSVRKSTSYYNWIISALLNHRDAAVFREDSFYDFSSILESDFNLSVTIDTPAKKEIIEEKQSVKANADEYLTNNISERISYVYPFIGLKGVSSKRTASSLDDNMAAFQYFAQKKPSFLTKEPNAAERGTAVHKFLEFCDIKRAAENAKNEADRLLNNEIITEDEYKLIDFSKIEKLFNSTLGRRLVSSEKVYREYKFSVFRKAGEIYKGLDKELSDEQIVVEGIIDCAFYDDDELILIDYKTDRVDDINLLKLRYENQLEAYKKALFKCEGKAVDEAYIYSLYLSEFILI
ncbi:MAG: helicase-exonuclease AddAB subunit AddA [Clostridiales bacterium]|nr:helicase-exonuclease AddAB subunit AddA [Clostridiales bacterium]